jgi:methyl-accepting chemotaxis protein
MALAAGAVGVLALAKLSAVNAGTNAVAGNATGLQHLAEAQRVATALRADLRDHILATGDKIATFSAAIADDDKQLEDALGRFEASGTVAAADRAAVAQFRTTFAAYQKLRDGQVLPLSSAGDKAGAYRELTGEAVPVYKQAMSQLAQLMAQQVAQNRAEQARAGSDYRSARVALAVVLCFGLALSVLLAVVVTRTITTPLHRVDDVLLALAQGDLTQTADVDQNDEIGEMARALRTANDGIRDSVRAMAAGAQSVSQAAVELAAINGEIATMAEQTSRQADAMSATTSQLSGNVELVAAGTEELGSSIRQISEDADRAAQLGTQAVDRVQGANHTVTELGDSSARIGQVLNLITSIAEQTNLLALNATIEAARAGEAGKGFAVVANEVKDLAGETSRATGDIEEKVRDIQTGTSGAVDAMSAVTADMERINDYQTSIAGAVEQQSATSAEIARNVHEAAAGSREIAGHVAEIAEAARSTSTGVRRNQQAADRLSGLSEELREAVARFRY